MRTLLLCLTLAGCADQLHATARFPKHREQEEARITALENKVARLEKLIEALAPRPEATSTPGDQL